MLNPGGVMLVSLYSRLARKPLKELRSSIAPNLVPQQGLQPNQFSMPPLDDSSLRRFRQQLLARTWASEDFMLFSRSPDFHSLARLHDTFFHPLETEYNLLEVKEILHRLGLKCLGLDADPNMVQL